MTFNNISMEETGVPREIPEKSFDKNIEYCPEKSIDKNIEYCILSLFISFCCL